MDDLGFSNFLSHHSFIIHSTSFIIIFFSHCYEKKAQEEQLKGRRIYFGSQLQEITVSCDREGLVVRMQGNGDC